MTPPMVTTNQLKPYGFQRKAYEFIHYHGTCYLMLDMGMGKTRICIEVGKTIEYPMFILANKFAALDTWPEEFQKWDKSAKIAVLHGKNKERIWANSDQYTNIILNYEGLKWFFDTCNKNLRPLQKYYFVFDEASMIKNSKSIRWKILADMMPIMSHYRTALSGTPAPQSLEDLWAQYFLLDEGKSLTPEYYQFRSRFFNYTGAYGEPPFLTTIKSGADKEIFRLIKPLTMRLKSEDYFDLPPIVHNPIRITMPPKLHRMYETLEHEFMLEFPDTTTVIANSAAVRDHKLRQFLQGAVYATDLADEGSRHRLRRATKMIHDVKAQVIKQLLETSAGQPLMVATQFQFEIPIIEKVLGRKVPNLTGATSGSEGKQIIADFKAGKLPLLVVHPKSAAYSLNLQSGGSKIVFSALPWELDLYQQLIKRLQRPGQEAANVVVTTIAFKNTVDDKIACYLSRKGATQQGLFNAMIGG